jgi:hypothetical protein
MAFPGLTRTTQQVINNAFYLIGLINPNETLPGYYTDEAIYLLNTLLDHYMAVERLIPYFENVEFQLVIGKNVYENGPPSFKKVSSIGAASLEIDNVSYPLELIKYFNLDGVAYTTNVSARPTVLIMQNQIEFSKLIFYPIPDREYQLKMRVKHEISHLSDQSLLDELPVDYHRFLTYALARELSSVFRVSKAWTPLLENEYQTMKQNLMDNADLELGADGNRGQINLPRAGYRFGTWNLGVIL